MDDSFSRNTNQKRDYPRGPVARQTMKTLRRNGINAETWACRDYADLKAKLEADVTGHHDLRHAPITHVIVSAPSWVLPENFHELCLDHHNIEFVQLNHSGCAFLSIDRNGIKNIRGALDLTLQLHNMRVAGNNRRFVNWVNRSFDVGIDCLYLPNLYDVRSFVNPYVWPRPHGHLIKIGSFGAWRPWKNQLTAAMAAVQLANQLGVELELYVNVGRTEGATGQRMGESRAELFDNLRGHKLIEVPWERWAKFRHTVGQMHLLGVGLLNDRHAIEDARNNLIEYAHAGLHRWRSCLNGNQKAMEAPCFVSRTPGSGRTPTCRPATPASCGASRCAIGFGLSRLCDGSSSTRYFKE